ncbi:MAG: GNAT family N-acetyltransferase [Colwellia polaris]|jgi:hypothetical protein
MKKLESSYTVVKAIKSDKKDVLRFYKSQQYSARFIGQDHCYIIKVDNKIIASALISAGQENSNSWLLHALVIDKSMRGNKLASFLIRAIINNRFHNQALVKVICFADEKLQQLYIKNNFIKYNETKQIATLPDEFQQRLKRYQMKNKNLCCYFFSNDNPTLLDK